MDDVDKIAVKRCVVHSLLRAAYAERENSSVWWEHDKALDDLFFPMADRLACSAYNLRRLAQMVADGRIALVTEPQGREVQSDGQRP